MLQGGNELTPPCRDMDRGLLALAAHGPVVVVPLAARPGGDYEGAGRRAEAHFSSLGADVVVAPDARRRPDEAQADVNRAGLVVLPGGSPRLLRDALETSGLGAVIAQRWRSGVPVMGSSAGAMVACATTLLPQWRGNPSTGPGLGLVGSYVVVPHFDGRRSGWVRAALATGNAVLGIPECSGVVVGDDGSLASVGVAASTLITAESRSEVPRG
jgi:cyanophycinase-like exopeptidase